MGDRKSDISLDDRKYREEFWSAGEEFCSCHGDLDGTNNEFHSCSDDDTRGYGDDDDVDDDDDDEYETDFFDSNQSDPKKADECVVGCMTNVEFPNDLQESIGLVDKKMGEDESDSSINTMCSREHQMPERQHISPNYVSNSEQEWNSQPTRNHVIEDDCMDSDMSKDLSAGTCYEDGKSGSLESTSRSRASENTTAEKNIGVMSKQIGLVVGNRQLTSIVGSTVFSMTENDQQKDKSKVQSRIQQKDSVKGAPKTMGSHQVPAQSTSLQTEQNIGDEGNVRYHSNDHSRDTKKADLKEQESSLSIGKQTCVPEHDRLRSDVKSSLEEEDPQKDLSINYLRFNDEIISKPEAPTIGNVDDCNRSQIKDETEDLLILILSSDPDSMEDVERATTDTCLATNDVFPIQGHIHDEHHKADSELRVKLLDDGRRGCTHCPKCPQEHSTCDRSGCKCTPEDDALQNDITSIHSISNNKHKKQALEEINQNSHRKLSKEARSPAQQYQEYTPDAETKTKDELLDNNEDHICNYCLKHLHESSSDRSDGEHFQREELPQSDMASNNSKNVDRKGKQFNKPVKQEVQGKLDESEKSWIPCQGNNNIDDQIKSSKLSVRVLSDLIAGAEKAEVDATYTTKDSISIRVNKHSDTDAKENPRDNGKQNSFHCLKFPNGPSYERSDGKGKSCFENINKSSCDQSSARCFQREEVPQKDSLTNHVLKDGAKRNQLLDQTKRKSQEKLGDSDKSYEPIQGDGETNDQIPSKQSKAPELSYRMSEMWKAETNPTITSNSSTRGDKVPRASQEHYYQPTHGHDDGKKGKSLDDRNQDFVHCLKYTHDSSYYQSRSMQNLSTKDALHDDLQTKQCRNGDQKRSPCLAGTNQNSDRKLDSCQREDRSGDVIPSIKSFVQELSGSIAGNDRGMIDATPTTHDSIYIRVDESFCDQSDAKRSPKNVPQNDPPTNHLRKNGANRSQPVKRRNRNSQGILDDEEPTLSHQRQTQKADIQYPDGSLCSPKNDLPRNLRNDDHEDNTQPLIRAHQNYQGKLNDTDKSSDQYQLKDVNDTATSIELSIPDASDAITSMDIAEADAAFVTNPSISISGNTGLSDTWSQKKHFYDMWLKGKFCDVNIVVDGQVFSVHRVVLAANSEYFERFFLDSPARTNDTDALSVYVTEMSADIFRVILQYMYTGRIDIQHGQISQLLTGALFLSIKCLTSALQEFLLKTWKGECIGAFCLAQTAGLHDLNKVILNYIRTHFVEVSTSEHFALCPAEHVSAILSDDNLWINEETDVLYAVLLWLEHHTRDISSNLRLLRHVRFEYIPLATIDRIEKGHLKSLANESVKRYIHDARKRASCLGVDQLHFDPPIIRQRMPEVVECRSLRTNGSQSIESTNIDRSFQASDEEKHVNPSKNSRTSAHSLNDPPIIRQRMPEVVECRSLRTNGSQSIESTSIDRSFQASDEEKHVNPSKNSRTSAHSLNDPPIIRQRMPEVVKCRSLKTNGVKSIESTNIDRSFQASDEEKHVNPSKNSRTSAHSLNDPPIIRQRMPEVVKCRSLRTNGVKSIESTNIDRSFQASDEEKHVNPSKNSRTSAHSQNECLIFPSKGHTPSSSKASSCHSAITKSTPFPSYHEIDTCPIRVSVFRDVTTTSPVLSDDDLTESSSMDTSAEDESSVQVVRIGGISRTWKDDCVHNDIEKLENGRGKRWEDWTSFAELPVAMHHHAACYIHNSIYISGGHVQLPCDARSNHFQPSRLFHVYDLMKEKWYRLADLDQARVFHQMVALFGQLYVIGGQGHDGGALSAVERYSPYTDSWRRVAPISFPRYATAAAAYNFHLWVAGGASNHVTSPNAYGQQRSSEEGGTSDYDGFYKSTSTFLTAIVECYSPHNNSWTKINDLPTPRCHASLVRINKRLFLVGGFCSIRNNPADDSSTSSVDVLDDVIESWRYVTDIGEGNYSANTVVVESKIVILGKPGPFLESSGDVISIFDTSTKKWELRRSLLLEARVGHACCAIPVPSHSNLCQR